MHVSHVPDWALERSRSVSPLESIEAERTVLLVVDMQNGFIDEGYPYANAHARDILPNINALIAAARRKGVRVAFVRHTFSDSPPYALAEWQSSAPAYAVMRDLLRPGQPAHLLHRELDVRPEDIALDKHRYSAMLPNSSNLHDILQRAGIDTIVVTGTLTNCCCECTARDAAMMNYKVFAVSDAMATITDEEHNAALLNLALVAGSVQDTVSLVRMIDKAP